MRIAFGAGFFISYHFLDQFLSFVFFVSSGMLISSKIICFDVLSMPEVSWSDPDQIWEKSFFHEKISFWAQKIGALKFASSPKVSKANAIQFSI